MYTGSTIEATSRAVAGDVRRGLTEKEAAARLEKNGRNEMRSAGGKSWVKSFLEQLNDPLIFVLIGAAAVSVFLREISDAVIIGTVICVNAVVGLIQEGKAQKALDSLKKLTSPHAVVIREGVKKEIPAAELVVGDLVCLEAGCQVPADMRLVRSDGLKTEESSLTGESLPTDKEAAFLADQGTSIPLGDRRNMAYMSTVVTCGRGEGLVTATGMDTEIGRIAALISESEEELTPLQKRLGELGGVLSFLSLGLCAVLFLVAVIQKRNVPEMLLTAISLAVAAVPEGLPAVVTICLALSVTRMVRVGTIIRRLPSVETLGAVSVVCSDKTGTLTQNKMTVEKCYLDLQEWEADRIPEGFHHFLRGIVLCNDALQEGSRKLGDPTELALLELGQKYGIRKEQLERQFPRCGELAFDSDRKMMTTFHVCRGGNRDPLFAGPWVSCTKGAPERLLARCSRILLGGQILELTAAQRKRILEEAADLSREALRTLAVAAGCPAADFSGIRDPFSPFKSPDLSAGSGREEDLVFLGLLGMKDPPRPEAAEAVEIFRRAGVDTVMITGDHVNTAYAIGRQLHIVTDRRQCMTGEEMERVPAEQFLQRLDQVRVFARVSPAQKVEIVRGFQQKHRIVAMTGDGVNDAPSLKAADIGISMGMCGTDVAKQASDMILTDDNFATIEKAIEEGRGVYENIRKSVIFLLSSNLGELLTMFTAVLCGMASPLKSSHILWINLITDSLPALALGADHNDGGSLMEDPPRKPEEGLFSRGGLACTCFYGLLIAAISLAAFLMLPLAAMNLEGLLPAKLSGWLDPGALRQAAASWKEVISRPGMLSRAQTYAFTVLAMSQLFHAMGMRDMKTSVFRMHPLENKLMLIAAVLGFILQFAVTEIPFLIRAFGTTHLEAGEWVMLGGLAAFPLLSHEMLVLLGWLTKR